MVALLSDTPESKTRNFSTSFRPAEWYCHVSQTNRRPAPKVCFQGKKRRAHCSEGRKKNLIYLKRPLGKHRLTGSESNFLYHCFFRTLSKRSLFALCLAIVALLPLPFALSASLHCCPSSLTLPHCLLPLLHCLSLCCLFSHPQTLDNYKLLYRALPKLKM